LCRVASKKATDRICLQLAEWSNGLHKKRYHAEVSVCPKLAEMSEVFSKTAAYANSAAPQNPSEGNVRSSQSRVAGKKTSDSVCCNWRNEATHSTKNVIMRKWARFSQKPLRVPIQQRPRNHPKAMCVLRHAALQARKQATASAAIGESKRLPAIGKMEQWIPKNVLIRKKLWNTEILY